ncbi:hypothetical protein B0A55_01639 [Friedmanniomyces simplex]|uniref:SUN domain-containing protein n=1 Tax=Friedmanniomyces simplex TaxID=329884 RepID=A0A4U0XWH0_9PEZI|nr:hypothetical protein B0A55_01639 [Friedmanniomyces simplex]
MLEVLRRGSLLPLLLLASNTVYATASRDGSGSSGRPGTATAGTTTTAAAASSLPVSVSAGAYNRPSNSTCISGTVNYITHTLPQQCLRTDRTSANGTQTSSTSVGAVLQTAQSPAYNHTLNATSKAPIQETTVSDNETAIAVSSNGSSPVVATSSPTAGSVNSVTASRGDATLSQDTANGEESLFDSAAFLSFEEWKKQNLAKTGQSPDNVGQERAQSGDRQRPGIHNALDTLGEDSEIDLDFAGFGNAAAAASSRGVSDPESVPPTTGSSEAIASGQSTATSAKLRSRDAGKTCKARTNYASFDCAATVMKQNAECKHASSILVENKDSYMLNKCSASNKFFIVELCNDIHIDTVVLANYEFFSSIFRHFRVSVSDRYPVKADKWKELGTFEARNTREVQAFLIEEPQIWARYLRVEFLTHYGSEYYCPVSLLRVHGRTMMQEFRQEEEMARGELSDEEATLETEGALPVELQEALTATDESEKATVQAVPPESFFKSISKRLQQLESNSTLSLQYIEEQSRILRDAFNKVEKRQISATKTFLSHLNETVMTELHGFRQAYDQLWQGTVIELEGQRDSTSARCWRSVRG